MTSLIKRFVDTVAHQNNKPSIRIVGDAMLDQYFDVEATRISPEFPIPVMRSNGLNPSETRPGGAANVAYQLTHWNADASLHAWLDNEAFCFLNANLNVTGIRTKSPFFIPRKMRIYDGNHPAFRWDIEDPVDPEYLIDFQRSLLGYLGSLPSSDVLILSDYNKGIFDTRTDLGLEARQQWIRNASCPVIVDPKSGPLEGWRGCSVFKPNKKEAEELSNLKDWKAQCRFFLKELQCNEVVITQGDEGVVGMSLGYRPFEYRPNFQVDAKSVIGAGDCFAAFLALAMAHKFDIAEAAEIAYKAGAVYVTHNRNEPITPHELLAFESPTDAKFLPPPAKRDFKLGFTNGCFDLLHAGHLASLRFAKQHCDKLMVAVNSNQSVRRLKGERRPYIELCQRMELLAALDCVDYVVSFEEDTPYNVINLHRPDVLIKGEDYRDKEVVGADLVKEVVFVPLMSGVSTSQIEYNIQSWA